MFRASNLMIVAKQLVEKIDSFRSDKVLVFSMNESKSSGSNKKHVKRISAHLSQRFRECRPRISLNLGSSSIWYLSMYSCNSSVPNTFAMRTSWKITVHCYKDVLIMKWFNWLIESSSATVYCNITSLNIPDHNCHAHGRKALCGISY